MNPELLPQRFGGEGGTNLHPAVVVALLLTAALILLLPRRYMIAPLLAAIFLIPMDQVLVIGVFHFQMTRILISIGWIRLLASALSSSSQFLSGGRNAIDKAVVLSTLFGAAAFVLLWRASEALVNQLGVVYTSLGSYLLLRFLIRDQEDVARTIRIFAYTAIPIALIMITEQATGRNPYAFLGGSLEAARATLMQRESGIRAMGSFSHPIAAGVFGAISFPLFIALRSASGAHRRQNRSAAVIGSVPALLIVMASVSSTGLLALVSAIMAFCFWPLRKQMRSVRWAILFCLIALHMVMKAPVWAVIGHMGVIGGSDSWHRYLVLDQFIHRFPEWWLLGTKDNYDWGYGMWDITNQYVAVGLSGGLLPLLLFFAVIIHGFKYLGRARKAIEKDQQRQRFLWALGAALIANAAAFVGVVYYDQIQVAWYALLAIISVATGEALQPRAATRPPVLHACAGQSPFSPTTTSLLSPSASPR